MFKSPHFALKLLAFSALFVSRVPVADADKLDVFNLSLTLGYKYDSNVFRLPDGQTPPASMGEKRADLSFTRTLALNVDEPIGLQRVQLTMSYSLNTSDSHELLNYHSVNYDARWKWALTPSLTGELYATQNQQIASYNDYRNFTQQNVITNKTEGVEADFSPHQVWHVLAGYSRNHSSNSGTFTQQAGFRSNNYYLGVKYAFSSGTTIAYYERRRVGQFLNQEVSYLNQVDDGYKEKESEFQLNWLLSAKSILYANYGNVQRDYNHVTLRNYDEDFWGLRYLWMPTAKLAINAEYKREAAPFFLTTSSYTLMDTLSITPEWAITAHTKLGLNYQKYERKFTGDGPLGFLQFTPRRDNGDMYGITLYWTPRDYMGATVSLMHDERRSTWTGYDYSDNMIIVNGKFNF